VTRHFFAPEPIFLTPVPPAVIIGISQPFALYDSREGGNQITDCTASDGLTQLTPVNGRYLADGTGQPPAFYGPNDVVLLWLDAGGDARYPLFAVDVFPTVVAKVLEWIASGGTVDYTSQAFIDAVVAAAPSGAGAVDYTSASFKEAVQDLVADEFAGTQGAGVSVAYNDTTGKLAVTVASGTSGGLDAEGVQDVLGAMVTQAGGTYNDTAGTITLPSSGGGTATFDAEAVRDAIGTAMSGTGMVTVTSNDAADTIVVSGSSALAAALSAKADLVGGKVPASQLPTSSTPTGILPVGILPAGTNPPAGSPIPAYYLTPVTVSTSAPAASRVAASSVSNAATKALLVPIPAGAAVGDVAIVSTVHSPSDGATTPAATAAYTAIAGSGWTGKASSTLAFSSRMEVYATVLTSDDLTNGLTINVVNVQQMVASIEVLRNVAGGLAGVTATILKDTTSTSVKPLPSLPITQKSLVRALYGERRTDASLGGTFATSGAAITPDFWTARTGTGAVALALATYPAADTDSTAGGSGDAWTITTPGATGTAANPNGYAAVVAIASA